MARRDISQERLSRLIRQGGSFRLTFGRLRTSTTSAMISGLTCESARRLEIIAGTAGPSR